MSEQSDSSVPPSGRRRRTRGRSRRMLGCAVASVGAVAVLAACSSSGSGGSGGATNDSSTPASSVPGGDSAQVKAAQAVVAQYTATPTKITVTTPLKSKPTPHTIVFLESNLPQGATAQDAVAEAAKAAGWTEKAVPFQSDNPATLVSGLKQALQYHPTAVSLSGTPESLWQSVLPLYRKAHAIIIPQTAGPSALSDVVPANLGSDGAVEGKILANWVTADSGGRGKVLLADLPDFGLLKADADSFTATMKAGCSGCSITPLNFTVSDQENNKIVPAIVSALQRNPSIKYVVATDGIFTSGLPAALKAAGISGVKITGAIPTAINEQDLLNGNVSSLTTFNFDYVAWQTVDVALRYAEGMKFPSDDGGVPEQLITKNNFTGPPADSATAPSDFRQQFKKLWHVS